MPNDNALFQSLKSICVPLLHKSEITPANISNVSHLLSQLHQVVTPIYKSPDLTPSLIAYTFFPLSTILRRNASEDIPDQVLEKVLSVLNLLCEQWWWYCDLGVWEQLFKLCGTIVGGLQGKGKGKERAEETKTAAAECLYTLTRLRAEEDSPSENLVHAINRVKVIEEHVQTNDFIPILGETTHSLLGTVLSDHKPLQQVSLKLLVVLLSSYVPDYLVPSVLPGVVSGMTKVALGSTTRKGWNNGEVVDLALQVMDLSICRAISDEVCIKEGALRKIVNLEDYSTFTDDPPEIDLDKPVPRYATKRTTAWLNGTSSQLHIAINALTPLVTHPNPIALVSLARFSRSILTATPLTLPQTKPLLLSFLLSLSNSPFPSVHEASKTAFHDLFRNATHDENSRALLLVLIQTARDNLAAVPRLIASQGDAKIEHVAKQIEAVCKLAAYEGISSTIPNAISKLLGPSGGIEKWGYGLLSVLEFENPAVSMTPAYGQKLFLEPDSSTEGSAFLAFPEMNLVNVSSRSARDAIASMMQSLGKAAQDGALFAVEWFIGVGKNGRSSNAVAALWCATQLLSGAACVSLHLEHKAVYRTDSKRMIKFAKTLAKEMAEIWDTGEEDECVEEMPPADTSEDSLISIEHVKGITKIRAPFNIDSNTSSKTSLRNLQPLSHRALSLQLISITAGVLQVGFGRLLIYTLYPILHSIVSPYAFLSSTAFAAITFVAAATASASPANLLISNFDYALDGVSRRLSRRWLDLSAPKVLFVLVRMVGSEVIERAADVVEECFDRLDELHGYSIVVERLVEVLAEVVRVVVSEQDSNVVKENQAPATLDMDDGTIAYFQKWYMAHKIISGSHLEDETYEPAPRRAWGKPTSDEDIGKEKEPDSGESKSNSDEPPPLTPIQSLIDQIVSRSLFFLTHDNAMIRARILGLLSSSVPVLPDIALLSSVHKAWPFILNRLSDSEPYVISAAASLIEALSLYSGTFMYRRIWDDVWPRFRSMLSKLDQADGASALARRGAFSVGTESAYTHSHRLYRSLLRTMTAAAKGVDAKDTSVWQVIMAFRRFLHAEAHAELQSYARALYIAVGKGNTDAVWLALSSTAGSTGGCTVFMQERKWRIETNLSIIMQSLDCH